jgi:RNA polymerase sigma-70 factor (ECF subfamily)
LRSYSGGATGEPEGDSDTALVERARAGDVASFETLMRRHERRAYAIAIGLLKDENDAREVVQEAFLRVHRGLAQFQGTATFFTWLYRIVTNLSIDLMRRPQRHETDSLDQLQVELLADLMGHGHLDADPLEVLWRKELVQRVAQCVSALPPYHRGVIVMREIDGLSYEEMARTMGVSKGTIMSRLFHARQKLQRSLAQAHSEMSGGTPPCRPRVMLGDGRVE